MMIFLELSEQNYLIKVDSLIDIGNLNSQNQNLSAIVAQSVTDPNILQQMVDAWNNFVTSGQIWALLIGFLLGFLLRGITA